MGAVAGGLGAALMWACASLAASRTSRMLSSASVIAWVMLVGFVLDVAAIALLRSPAPTGMATWSLLAVGGGSNIVGLLLFVTALRIGKVGILAPIVSTEGAMAAVFSVIAGERLQPLSYVLLGTVAVGVLVSTFSRDPAPLPGERKVLATTLTLGAALANAVSIYATGHLSSTVPVVWAILPARLIGVLVLAVPLASIGRLRITRRATPYLLLGGVAEVVGVWCYAIGARQSIAVAAALSALFASFTVLGAFLFFHERLTRRQFVGVGLVVVSIGALTVVLHSGG